MFNEDLDVFFDADEHGTEATLEGSAITGIYLREYFDPEGIATRQTSFVTKESHGAEVGDTLIVVGLTFRVVNVQPDGTGVVVLVLERQ